jgi:hypothetical protein
MGAMAMTYKLRTRRELAFVVVIVVLACAAAFVSLGLTHPKPFQDAALGAEWQCSKTLIMTSCIKVVRASPAPDRPHNAMCTRRT